MKSKLVKSSLKKYLNTELIVLVLLFLFELVHIKILFQNYDFLAGGDNYPQLKVISKRIYPYVWDNTLSLGGRTVSMPNLLGIPLYAYIFSFLSPQLLQRILIFSLYLLKYIAFIKLAKLVSKKFSILSILPAILLFSFNAYESLNPFALFPLVFSIYLPLSLYYFIQMLENAKIDYVNISKLVFLSIIFSTLNSNLALSITIFIPQIIYIIIRIRNLNKTRISSLIIYYATVFLTSLWWFLPLANYYLEAASEVFKNNWFSFAVDVSQLFQNYRFIGQWGWYESSFLYPYYPFSTYYDNPFIVFFTYSIILMAIYGGFTIEKENRRNVLKNFLLILSFSSLFLVGGSRPPFGLLYGVLFNYVPVFKIFREPFTKFNEIYILSISVLFYFFLLFLEQKLLGLKKYLAFFLIFLIVIFSVKPSLIGEHVWSKWNGSMRSFRVNIPEYWLGLKDYVDKNIENSRILSFPKVYYGSAWNWANGFSSADDVSINFINNKNMVLRNPSPSGFGFGKMVDNAYEQDFLSSKYFALLGVDYVLLENDLDFRYSGNISYTPNKSVEILNDMNLEKPVNFGNFTYGYLSGIQNNEIDENTKYEMNYELYGKPQLSLYEVKDLNRNKQFFPAANILFAVGDESDIKKVTSFDDFKLNSVIFLLNKDLTLNAIKNPDEVYISAVRKSPQLLVNELQWNLSWEFPDANINPASVEYIFVRINELFHKMYSRGNTLGNIDLLVKLSAKRANEIEKYKLVDALKNNALMDMNSNISTAIKLIQSTPVAQRDDSYWETVKKTIMFIKRNELVLGNSGNSKAYLDLIKWVENNINAKCLSFCYEFKVPIEGSYEIYVDKSSFDNLGYNTYKIEGKEFTDFTYDISTNQKFWNKLGNVNLKKGGIYKLNLSLKEPKNLLEQGEWKSYKDVNNKNDFIRDFFPDKYVQGYGYVFNKSKSKNNKVLNNSATNNYVKFKSINDWTAGKSYKISFDYEVEKGGLGISIVEDYLNYREMYKEMYEKSQTAESTDGVSESYISRAMYQKEFDLNSLIGERGICNNIGICTYHFEETTISSRNAKGAKLFFYSFSNNGLASNVSIENIKVEEILDPKIALRYVSDDSSIKGENPKIEFKKINPTKYILNVTGAKIPYTLVFNESFNKDWKLVYQGKPVVPESKHFLVNGYANAWEIDPSYVNNSQDYSLIVEFSSQKYFVIFFTLTAILFAFASFIILFDLSIRVRKRNL